MEYTTSHRGNSTSLPSIATQQANRIKQLEAQAAKLIASLQAADEHITRLVDGVEIARCHALNDPNGRLSLWFKEYDAWRKQNDASRPTA